jgi:hypothetical protein
MENPIESNDLYWDVIKKAWPYIVIAYQAHEDKKTDNGVSPSRP